MKACSPGTQEKFRALEVSEKVKICSNDRIRGYFSLGRRS